MLTDSSLKEMCCKTIMIAFFMENLARFAWRRNGIYRNDPKDDMDGNTIPTPYVQQFLGSGPEGDKVL